MNVREWALPVYTIMIQLAAGALSSLWVVRALVFSRYKSKEIDRVTRVPILILLFTICLAIVGAHFHLSKPFLSILAVRNFGRSWLSREIVFTIAFFLSTAVLVWLTWFVEERQKLKKLLGWASALFGLMTVFCIASVYMLPTQLAWNSNVTIFSYFSETLLLGTTALAAILLMDLNFYYEQAPENAKAHAPLVAKALVALAVLSFVSLIFTLLFTAEQIIVLRLAGDASAQASMRLLLDLYGPLLIARFGLNVLGVGWLLFNLWSAMKKSQTVRDLISPAYIAATLVLVGGILGRFLFYAIHVRIGI